MVPGDARAEVVLLCGGEEVARWPLACEDGAHLRAVDEVARLQLEAGRQGCTVWLHHACPDLVAVLQVVGLADVIPVGPLKVARKPEGLEEGGVEEVVVPDDPVA